MTTPETSLAPKPHVTYMEPHDQCHKEILSLNVSLPNAFESDGFGGNLPGEICCCGPPLFCRSIACVVALPVHNQGKSTATPLSLPKSFKCESLKCGKLRKLMSIVGYYYCAGHAHRYLGITSQRKPATEKYSSQQTIYPNLPNFSINIPIKSTNHQDQ